MGEDSEHRQPLRRAALPIVVAVVLAVGGGALAWAASATADQPGRIIDVKPVIDDDSLETPGPEPAPAPAPAPEPVPAPAPEPVPAPPPDDDDDDDD